MKNAVFALLRGERYREKRSRARAKVLTVAKRSGETAAKLARACVPCLLFVKYCKYCSLFSALLTALCFCGKILCTRETTRSEREAYIQLYKMSFFVCLPEKILGQVCTRVRERSNHTKKSVLYAWKALVIGYMRRVSTIFPRRGLTSLFFCGRMVM